MSIDVEVNSKADPATSNPTDGYTAVVTDRAANRAWSGEGDTATEAATEAVRKFLGDRRAREYVEK